MPSKVPPKQVNTVAPKAPPKQVNTVALCYLCGKSFAYGSSLYLHLKHGVCTKQDTRQSTENVSRKGLRETEQGSGENISRKGLLEIDGRHVTKNDEAGLSELPKYGLQRNIESPKMDPEGAIFSLLPSASSMLPTNVGCPAWYSPNVSEIVPVRAPLEEPGLVPATFPTTLDVDQMNIELTSWPEVTFTRVIPQQNVEGDWSPWNDVTSSNAFWDLDKQEYVMSNSSGEMMQFAPIFSGTNSDSRLFEQPGTGQFYQPPGVHIPENIASRNLTVPELKDSGDSQLFSDTSSGSDLEEKLLRFDIVCVEHFLEQEENVDQSRDRSSFNN